MFEQKIKNAVRNILEENKFSEKGILERENKRLTEDLAKLESSMRIQEQELKSLIKIKEEKMAIELLQKELNLQKEHNNKALHVLEVRNNQLSRIIYDLRQNLKDIQDAIVQRLPNVNVEVKKR